MRALIHPKLGSRVRQFFPSIGQVATMSPTRSASGAEVPAWRVKVESVRCAISPVYGLETIGRIFTEQTTHIVNLDGYFPAITPKDKITIDGVEYDIQSVTAGITFTSTQLQVKLVVPSV